jgi:cell division septation protein DedD
VQVAALNDPSRAADLVAALRADGFSAYLVAPPAGDPDAPYKIRVGSFETRDEADRAAQVLEKSRGQKAWVVRER